MADRSILKEVELFLKLDDSQLEIILNEFEEIEIKKGEFLFKVNDKRNNIYVIAEGLIYLYNRNNKGTEVPIAAFGEKDFFGESSILDRSPHGTTAKAIEDTKVFALHYSKFDKILDQYPKIGSKILAQVSRTISRRLRYTTNQVVESAAQYLSGKTRVEHDLLGEQEIPFEAYYGIQTKRAMDNFPITGVAISHYHDLIIALAQIKKACARANYETGEFDVKVYKAINQACDEIIRRRYHTHFTVDVFQGGAGTSTNMNANEVIANRALEIMGYDKGDYQHCHPNNHINLSQSTNDVYPSSIKIAAYYKHLKLRVKLEQLVQSFKRKGEEFKDVLKMGRTQLQDAVPMTLGQEFTAYAVTIEEEIDRLDHNSKLLLEINMGGTAIGTGLNASPEYKEKVNKYLREVTKLDLTLAENLVEATQDTGAFVIYSSALKRLAVKLSKISNDLRLLSSGPRAGFNEINLPRLQPGSSIMPGKVNPVMPELVNQVAFNVIGNDLTITLAAEAGQLQLNVMEPVIANSLFEMLDMLKNAIGVFAEKCIDGIEANEEVTKSYVWNSIGIVTALNPILGYEKSSEIAKEALSTGKSVTELVLEKGWLSKEQLDELLSVDNLLGR